MIKVTDKGYFMDGYLKQNIDTLMYNIKHDWDFIIPITGSGMVRVGKSMLGQQVGYYAAYTLGTPFGIDNVVFSGDELIKIAARLPKNSVIIYDEARAELDSKKAMEKISKTLQDFFAECGMYNHFMIIILPDYFELNKKLALSRSDALINVFRASEVKNVNGNEVLAYKRGYFEFFNRERKKKLYILGKKNFEDYSMGMQLRNFWGNFPNFWVLDKAEYDKKKLSFLQRERGTNEPMNKYHIQRDALLSIMNKDFKITQEQIVKAMLARGIKYTQQEVSYVVKNTYNKIQNRNIFTLPEGDE